MVLAPTAMLREQLLSVHGIGPETADAILLYAGNHPVFVVDAYARRILERHQLAEPHHGYEYLRFEGLNRHKPMLHLAMVAGFDVVGTRWDSMRSDLLIQFEKALVDEIS